ncbi:MAG: rRNA maturation RNase YbeY [Roseibacillus sp.]
MEPREASSGISVRNQQEKRAIPAEFTARMAASGEEALRLLVARYLDRVKSPGLVSVTLIDDAEIGRVHGEFMGDPNPTDVITFAYGEEGEILISVETAERHALEYGASVELELVLYLIHGLLHLCGYEDTTDSGREEMAELQEALVGEVFEEL